MPHRFELRERVDENRVGRQTGDPKSFAVRCDPYAVRGRAQALLLRPVPGRFVRQFNSLDFLARRKVHHRKAVKVRQLSEYAARRTVGIGLERHRAYPRTDL